MVHAGLKAGWHIGQPKGHGKELIVSIVASENYLVHIMFSHSDLIVFRMQVNFGEVHYIVHLI
jgi:hypothetical protein